VEGELFRVDSWIAVMLGQRLPPGPYHPFARTVPEGELVQSLNSFRSQVAQAVARLPGQMEFIEQYCKASPEIWG
jgi:tryptophan halogenase